MKLVETISMEDQLASANLILINGPPLSGKTTSLMTTPEPRAILIPPGELGYTSIRASPTTKVFRWQDEVDVKVDWATILTQFEGVLREVGRGKYGKFETVAIDGLHVLYRLIQKALGYNENTDPKEFTRYHDRFNGVLDLLVAQPSRYRIATVYDGPELVDPANDKKTTKVYPDLPGKQAKAVMGRFPLVVHTFLFGAGASRKFQWHLQPNEGVHGAGLHLPREMAAKLPPVLEQDFGKLDSAIRASLGAVAPTPTLTAVAK